MQHLLLLVLSAGISAALAGSPASNRVTYSLGHDRIEFVREPQLAITVSANCLNKERSRKCEALIAFKKSSMRAVRPPREKRTDFLQERAALCEKAQGRVVIGIQDSGNENGFCLFRDHSMLDLGSLWAAALQNDSNPVPKKPE